MSKTTVALFFILLIVIGILFFVIYGIKQNPILTSLTQPLATPTTMEDTTLSFAINGQSVQPGQTVTLALLLHNANLHPSLTQLELAYDPTVVTIDSLMPGTFFTNPTVALQNIDPVTGRISYALRCPVSQAINTINNCTDPASSTLALITVTINSYTGKNATTLSFLPKTVIRTHTGRDILQRTTGLQLTITKQPYPISSSSAVASPGANYNH